MSEPRRTDDRDGEKERYEARRKRWWSSRTPKDRAERRLLSPGKKYTGYTKDPEEDTGFYGHVLPTDFKKTNIIRSHGKS